MLGLAGGSSTTTLKVHAVRLGLDTAHFHHVRRSGQVVEMATMPDLANLPRAGSMLAATWFTLCGFEVSWPLEPCRYDLLVRDREKTSRVQVKTTTVRGGNSWLARLATSGGARTYEPDEIDQFFVVTGDLSCYLIPAAIVVGLKAIQLSAYADFRVTLMP